MLAAAGVPNCRQVRRGAVSSVAKQARNPCTMVHGFCFCTKFGARVYIRTGQKHRMIITLARVLPRALRPLASSRGTLRVPLRYHSTVPIMQNLFTTCRSCGIQLQTAHPLKPGFWPKPKSPKIKRDRAQEIYNRFMGKALAYEKQLLTNGNPDVPTLPAARGQINHENKDDPQCLRCRNAIYHSKFWLKNFPPVPFDKVMELMPPQGKIAYVLSAQDFPLSMDELIFNYRRPDEVLFLVTKTDMLFQTVQLADRYGGMFFRDYLWRKYKVPPENVMVVSARSDWHMIELMKRLKGDVYLVGHANSGKSSLVASLVFSSHREEAKRRLKISNRRVTRDFLELVAKVNKIPKMGRPTVTSRFIRDYKMNQGPGTSYIPGFTRGLMRYEITPEATVYDAPGFAVPPGGISLAHMVRHNILKLLARGARVYEDGLYKSEYQTIQKKQVYTVGGLFAIESPANEANKLQLRNCINFEAYVFKDLVTALSMLENDRPKALNKRFCTWPCRYSRYIVPFFHGSVDLVFRNLGHVNITVTGPKVENQKPLVVWLPEGMDAIMRVPITTYTTKTLSGRDKNGNVLRKEKWVAKSTVELKRYTGKTPFHSRLIPSKDEEEDLEMLKKFATSTAEGYETWSELPPATVPLTVASTYYYPES